MPQKINKQTKNNNRKRTFVIKTFLKIYVQLKIIKTKSRSRDYYIMMLKLRKLVFTCICAIKM